MTQCLKEELDIKREAVKESQKINARDGGIRISHAVLNI